MARVLAVAAGPAAPVAVAASAALAAAVVAAAPLTRTLGRQGRGDQWLVGPGRLDLEPLGLGPRGARRKHGHDAEAVEVALDLGAQHLPDFCSTGEDRTLEGALWLSGTRGSPGPGPVFARAGELDVDPAGHRCPTLARRPHGTPTRTPSTGCGWCHVNRSAPARPPSERQRRDQASGSARNRSAVAGSVPATMSATVVSSRTERRAARVATHTRCRLWAAPA